MSKYKSTRGDPSEPDLYLRDLDDYIGSKKYYNVMGIYVTDGVKYIMENGYSWFVTDAIAVIRMKLKKEDFLSIKLIVKNDDAMMEISDGNGHVFYRQRYEWSDAKRNLTLFYVDNVLMLSSEY
jgi:hypothetical protein